MFDLFPDMRTIICGGQAGQGINALASVICKGIVEKGFYVFCSREYESRIKGGHNFNVITFSDKPIESNYKTADILIALDEETKKIHAEELKAKPIILGFGKDNMYYAGCVFKLLGLEFEVLEKSLVELKNYEENLEFARQGYGEEKREIKLPETKNNVCFLMSGSEGFAEGAISAGLEFYYGYPMTPATKLFAELSKNKKVITIESESEIAAVNSCIGSAITGAKSMAGTSGGGFDLMTEGLSLAGKAGIPIILYLAQRHGASTGVPTATGQGDLNVARHSGHGEFPRIIIAPGDAKEAIEKTCEMFYLTQKYQMPGILIGDKHLAESIYSFSEKPKIMKSESSIKWPVRFTSYESDREGSATENPEEIKKAAEERIKKQEIIGDEIENFEPYKMHGKTDSENLIVGWGSTKGAIIDAMKDIDCKFLQVIYLEPLSKKIKKELEKAKNIIAIENNSTSQLSELIAEKTGMIITKKILKYDGRQFLADELAQEIKRLIR